MSEPQTICDVTKAHQHLGLRWQSVAATPLSAGTITSIFSNRTPLESGVALRFPPHSKTSRTFSHGLT